MGMMSQLQARKQNSTGTYQSGGTSSYPVTGFPATAYRGNNRRVGGGKQGQPSPSAGSLSSAVQYDPKHVVLTLGALVVGGYALWHFDSKRK